MRLLVAPALALSVLLLAPAAASARPCSDRFPVIIDGTQWIVYTGDSARERRELPCRKARRIARTYITTHVDPGRWDCSARQQRCTKGGTYIDRYGYRQPRYLVGWHHAD